MNMLHGTDEEELVDAPSDCGRDPDPVEAYLPKEHVSARGLGYMKGAAGPYVPETRAPWSASTCARSARMSGQRRPPVACSARRWAMNRFVPLCSWKGGHGA